MLVSIVIPCHNCENTIDRAVNSVLSQTHTDWELILVNNNSKDSTWEKIIHIKRNNPEKAITVLDEKKKGAPAARNAGLYISKGEWIQFLDADDEMLPEKIEKQLYASDISNADVVYAPYFKIKELGNEIIKTKIDIELDLWKGFMKSNLGITSANFFKKNTVVAINGWDETKSSSQEYDLMFRIAENGGVFKAYDAALVFIHYQENSISNATDSEKNIKRLLNFIELRTRVLIFLKKNNNISRAYQNLYDTVISKSFILTFRDNPLYIFTEFNKMKEVSIKTRLYTNWVFLKLKIRILLHILPE